MTYLVSDDRDETDDSKSWGHIIHRSQRIIMDPSQSYDKYCGTLMHEVLHAVYFAAGFSDAKEEDIQRLTSPFLRMIRDNPDLIAFLTRRI